MKNIITLHFLIFTKFLYFEDIIPIELTRKFLIENCIIQKKVNVNEKEYYLDLCYQIGENNICIEINEKHHSKIKDLCRIRNIILSTKNVIINDNLLQLENQQIYQQFIKFFCKFYYLYLEKNQLILSFYI
jgi:hypothetical protein